MAALLHSFRTTTLFSIIFFLFCVSLQSTHAAPSLSPSLIANSALSIPPQLDSIPSPHFPSSLSSLSSLSSRSTLHPAGPLVKREKYILGHDADGNLRAVSEGTREPIEQAPATNGAGSGFDAPAVMWLGFCIVVGAPMMLVGYRIGRIAAGVAVGCAILVAAWASTINSMSPSSMGDLVLTLVSLGFFGAGFAFGMLRVCHKIAPALLGILGGMAVGLRLVLLRRGLLFPGLGQYSLNWGIVAISGLVGMSFVFWKRTERFAVAFGCASVGAFFVFLAVDLAVSKQSGMSWGLRVLFDRNSNHIVDIVLNVYEPSTTTMILGGLSLASAPICAYAQYWFFTGPFLNTVSPTVFDPTMGRYVAETETVGGSTTELNPTGKTKPTFKSHYKTALMYTNNSMPSWLRGEQAPAAGHNPGRDGHGHAMYRSSSMSESSSSFGLASHQRNESASSLAYLGSAHTSLAPPPPAAGSTRGGAVVKSSPLAPGGAGMGGEGDYDEERIWVRGEIGVGNHSRS